MDTHNLTSDQIQKAVTFIERMDLYFQPKIAEKVNLHEYVHKVLSSGSFLYTSEANEISALVGFYANNQKDKVGYISYLAVNDKHFGQGLGRLLLTDVGAKMKEAGMVRALVETSASNVNARRFYIKNGFGIQSTYIDDFGIEKLNLVKEL